MSNTIQGTIAIQVSEDCVENWLVAQIGNKLDNVDEDYYYYLYRAALTKLTDLINEAVDGMPTMQDLRNDISR